MFLKLKTVEMWNKSKSHIKPKSICVFLEKNSVPNNCFNCASLQSIPEHYWPVWSLHLYLCFVFYLFSFFFLFSFSSLSTQLLNGRVYERFWCIFFSFFFFLCYFSTTTVTTTTSTTTSDNFFISSIITGYKELWRVPSSACRSLCPHELSRGILPLVIYAKLLLFV